jgi:hypothetical protein
MGLILKGKLTRKTILLLIALILFALVVSIIIIALNGIQSNPNTSTPTTSPTETPTPNPTLTPIPTPSPSPIATPISGKPSWVNVSGTFPATPALITIAFDSLKTHTRYQTDVTGTYHFDGEVNEPGHYSILLPNEDSYQVDFIAWGGMAGSIDGGILNINTYDSSITQNWNPAS